MKIYIDGHHYPSLEFDTKQSKYYIYTNDGIYLQTHMRTHMHNESQKELKKIEIVDTKIVEKNYKNYKFLKENSKIEYTNEIIYHIPYFHLYCEEEICKKNIGDGIFLVKLNYFDQTSYYFETDRTDDSLYDVIITFLSSI